MEIRGSRIMLTGASGGLGEAIAVELAAQGAELVLTARSREVLEGLARRTGGQVVVADLTDRGDVQRLCERLDEVDVLVANAGVGFDGDIEDITPADIDRCIDINLRSPMVMSTAFVQQKLSVGAEGQVVLVGSLAGLAATANTRLYNATKFGLRGFALALRQDLEGRGVGVTLVAPGFIRDAGMFAENGVELPPFVRTKAPADVAAGVVRAIGANPAEVFVAPVELRAGATFSTVAPRLSAAVQRRLGAADMTAGR